MSKVKLYDIPERLSDTEVLNIMTVAEVDVRYVRKMKDVSATSDDIIADWMNITPKTFRTLKSGKGELKGLQEEQVVLLISLFKQGASTFGSVDIFNKWLHTANHYLDGMMPGSLLNTITGIRFIADRLTALEYGDNV